MAVVNEWDIDIVHVGIVSRARKGGNLGAH